MSYSIFNGKYAQIGNKYAWMGAGAPAPSYPTDGLVSLWRFDNDLNDSYGLNNLLGGPLTFVDDGMPSTLNKCATLNDITPAYFDFGTSILPYSISIWAKNNASAENTTWAVVTDRLVNYNWENGGHYITFTTSGGQQYAGCGWTIAGMGFTFPQLVEVSYQASPTWNHFVITLSDANNLKFYYNSSSLVSYNLTFGTRIPKKIFFTSTYPGDAQISSCFLYNKVLSQEEVNQLYNSGAGV